MKKLICLIVFLFLLTGCDVEYNLKIDMDTFTEDVNIIVPNTETMTKIVYNAIKANQVAYVDQESGNRHYYSVKATSDDKQYNLDYRYVYSDNKILNSSAISQCYKKMTINTKNNIMNISTSPEFMCLYRDGAQIIKNASINITTPLKVLSSNADEVKDDTYIWYINNENYKDRAIKIQIEKTKDSKDFGAFTILLIILGVLVLLALILLVFIKMKQKRNNKL